MPVGWIVTVPAAPKVPAALSTRCRADREAAGETATGHAQGRGAGAKLGDRSQTADQTGPAQIDRADIGEDVTAAPPMPPLMFNCRAEVRADRRRVADRDRAPVTVLAAPARAWRAPALLMPVLLRLSGSASVMPCGSRRRNKRRWPRRVFRRPPRWNRAHWRGRRAMVPPLIVATPAQAPLSAQFPKRAGIAFHKIHSRPPKAEFRVSVCPRATKIWLLAAVVEPRLIVRAVANVPTLRRSPSSHSH